MKRAFSRKNLWEGAPNWVKRGVGAALKAVPPAWILGAQYRRNLAAAHASERWTRAEIEAYQLAQIRDICRHAFERSEFYRGRMKSVGFDPNTLQSPRDIQLLPLIDKQTIRENLDRMCTVPAGTRGVDEVSTGGSSGQPFKFYIGAGRSSVEFAYLVAGWARAGFRFGAPTAVFRGQVVDSAGGGMRHSYDPILRRHFYSNFHMSDGEMARYLGHVASLGPVFLLTYPSSADALARFILSGRHPRLTNVTGILSGSEMTYPGQRERCEQAFGCRYFTWYGHSEKLVMAAECEHSPDYHVWPGYGYCELVDASGRPVTEPGQAGEIVGTGFINRIMPFLRYRTGDWATLVGERCAGCGREFMLLRDIQGHRTQEVLVADDGTQISWVALNMHDDTFEGVRQFQFRQERAGEAELKLVVDPEFGDGGVARILRNLERKFDGRVRIAVRRVAEIPLTPRGKTVYVDQQMKLDGSPIAAAVPDAEEVRA